MNQKTRAIIIGTAVGILVFGKLADFVSIPLALLIGVVAGIVLGKLISNKVETSTQLPEESGDILLQSSANYIRKGTSVGGKLYLTTNGVEFKAHQFNFSEDYVVIPKEIIKSVENCKTVFWGQNGIYIECNTEERFKFSVEKRDVWTCEIQKILQKNS